MKDKSILKTAKTVYSAVAVLECILGLVMLCYPGFSLSALGIILGIGLVLFGVVELIAYFSGSAPLILSRNVLAGGIFFIILGVLVLTNPLGLMNFICIVVGVGILADSLFKLQSVLDVRQFMSRGSWWLVFAALLLSVLAGILLVFWPGESGRALIVLLGIGLLLTARSTSSTWCM